MAWYNYFNIEIPMLLTLYAMMMDGPVMTNLYIYRTCYTILNFPKENCSRLGQYEDDLTTALETKVQPTVNHINMVQSSIRSTIPLIVCMYVGLWSDRFGRKPFLIIPLVGMTITMCLGTVIVYLEDLTPWWFLASNMPALFTGGIGAYMLVITTYIADTTTTKQRALRLAFIDIILALASFLGNLSSSFLLYATNYLTVYLIASSLVIASLIFIIIFIPESLKEKESGRNSKNVAQMANFKAIIKDTFKKRPNNGRTYLLIIMLIMLLLSLSMGEMSVMTLFLRAKFNWTFTKITIVNSITSVLNIGGTVFGTVFLYKILKIKEFPLALFAAVTTVIRCILRAIATNDTYLYIAYVLSIFQGVSGVMLRTVTSFIISPQEMGKIFAVNSILFSLGELVSNLVYPYVYNLTLNTNSGVFNYLTAGMVTLAGILITYMMTVTFTHYQPSTEEERQEADLQKRKSLTLSNMEGFTVSQRLSLDIDARTFSIRSFTNNIR